MRSQFFAGPPGWSGPPGRRPRLVRLAVDTGLLAVLIAFALLGNEPEEAATWGSAPLLVAAVPLLVVAVAVARRRPVVAAVLPGTLSIVGSGNLYTGQLVVAQLAFSFLLGRRTDGRRALLGLGVVAAVLIGVFTLVVATGGTPGTADDWFEMLAGLVLQVLVPWAAGQYVYQHGEFVRAGWALAERLEHEQERAVGQARLRERARIAGDMHDSLGHDLSLVAVQAGALEASTTDLRQRAAAAQLRKSAAAVTGRLHEVVTMLRDDAEPAPRDASPGPAATDGDEIAALVERAAASGMRVILTPWDALDPDRGQLGEIAPPTARAAYRVVQESLTNAAKHARGAAVRVALAHRFAAGRDLLVVTVTNDAPPHRPAGDGTGYGLIGLDERVRVAGGSLSAAPTPDGGFEVTAYLPLRGRDAEGPASPNPAHPVISARPPRTAHAELATAQARLRRGMLVTFWTPTLAGVALVAAYLLGGGRL
ncbi:sensor histidine kinase [Promicromonospora soli]